MCQDPFNNMDNNSMITQEIDTKERREALKSGAYIVNVTSQQEVANY